MIKKNKIVALSLFALILGSAGAFFYIKSKNKKLNILIISTCSLSRDRLGFYSGNTKRTPNFDRLARHSFVFDNAITDMSWSNVSGFLSTIPADHLRKHGYHAIGRPWTKEERDWQQISKLDVPDYYMRMPNFRTSTRNPQTVYSEDLKDLKARVQDQSKWPFMIEVHNKMMHLPYAKPLRDKKHIIKMMKPDEQDYIFKYRENFERYPERLPLAFYVMDRGPQLTERVIKLLKLGQADADQLRSAEFSPTFVGLLNNTKLLERWKKSPFFETDLKIILATYDKMLSVYDFGLGEALNLYGNKKLQDNTVIIFLGDHGEAFNQHGYMVHGETVYDEMIRFPLFVKFPNQEKSIKIEPQFYQFGVAEIVRRLISGELNQDNFEETIKKEINHPMIYSRNCANNIKSLRYKNNWKLIWDLKSDKKMLFDLQKDPNELTDVYEAQPNMSLFLEESLEPTANSQHKNKMLHLCNPENE